MPYADTPIALVALHSIRPYSGRFDNFYEEGTYSCVVCKEDLFASNMKYDSGCGWPAFFDSIDKSKILIEQDLQLRKYNAATRSAIELSLVFAFIISSYITSVLTYE